MNKSAYQQRELQKLKKQTIEETRESVLEQELSARSWKAWWEKMYYTIECEKILPEYEECQKRMKEKAESEKAQFEEFKKNLAEELSKKNEADPVGELQVEGITDTLISE